MVHEDLVRQFHQDGYVIIKGAFDAREVACMRREADAVLELIINSSLAHKRRSRRLDMLNHACGGQTMVVKIQPINDLSLYLAEVSADDRLVGLMRALMDDEPVLMEEKLNYKQPLPDRIAGFEMSGRQTDGWGMHSDWAYYQAQKYPQSIISSAISVDECSADCGPLRVWPGSHRKHLPHQQTGGGLRVEPDLVDPDDGVDLLVPPGTVMLFSSLLIHNSRPNTSGRPRRLMIYSHYPRSADMGVDVRNGPTRLSESPYEWEYIRMRDRGDVQPEFVAPTYSSP